MTSPDFTYPQPTDDELAAQQPYTAPSTAALGSHVHGVSHGSAVDQTPAAPSPKATHSGVPSTGGNRPLIGKIALVITIVAAGLSLLASIALGVTIGPLENQNGYYFTDIPGWYQHLAIGLTGLQIVCAGLGVTGLIMGIVSAATGRARTQGIVTIAIAVLAPFVSFGIFMILSFTFA